MKKVLVIEDDRVMREVVAELLKEHFEVQTAVDGLAGVYAAFDTRPDVILLDLSMPRLGGWDVMEMLQGDTRTVGIPVVVMTALSGDEHRERAERAGAAFLGKPFDEGELLDVVSRMTS
jgi:CheY-like chemotaxis protein